MTICVLVPFPGFLYLYCIAISRKDLLRSRPLPGVLISLLVTFHHVKGALLFSSPSRGSYISTTMLFTMEQIQEFSSPSRGSYISTRATIKCVEIDCSRPLPGVLISLPCPHNSLNYIRIFLLLRRKCNSIPYTDLIPHKIQDYVLFSTIRGKTGRYWEQLI